MFGWDELGEAWEQAVEQGVGVMCVDKAAIQPYPSELVPAGHVDVYRDDVDWVRGTGGTRLRVLDYQSAANAGARFKMQIVG